jgi:hypothetical protein
MTSTPGSASSNLPGKPPVVDVATWEAAREQLLVREKAHTREGDAIAAARRRLPMVELDGTVEVTGVDGPVPFVDLFQASQSPEASRPTWTATALSRPVEIRIRRLELETAAEHGGGESLEGEIVLLVSDLAGRAVGHHDACGVE